jgi:hypothetical protein
MELTHPLIAFLMRIAGLISKRYKWQGLHAQVANSLPAELAQFVRNAHLPQLNPQASQCDSLGVK